MKVFAVFALVLLALVAGSWLAVLIREDIKERGRSSQDRSGKGLVIATAVAALLLCVLATGPSGTFAPSPAGPAYQTVAMFRMPLR